MPKLLYTASTASHLVNFHLPYLRWFQAAGWTVHAACGGGAATLPGVDRVVDLPFAKRMTAPENFRCARTLGALMEREDFDLVVTNTALAAFFTRLPLLARGKRRPPLVNIVHGYLFDEGTPAPKRQILLWAEKLTAPVTDLVLTMNGADRQIAARHCLGTQAATIPGMGVDFARIDAATAGEGAALRRGLALPDDAFVLVYPAEFSPRKNQAMLLRGLARLPGRVHLLLPGGGAELGRCRALAQSLGVADRVRFPGQVPDTGPWLRGADCAVSSSRSEGLPFNIMEAMRAGLPVLASDVKGHRDLLGGGAGVLYPYGDEAAFASAVALLLDDGDYRAKLGRLGAAAAEQYTLAQVFPQVCAALGDAGLCPWPPRSAAFWDESLAKNLHG